MMNVEKMSFELLLIGQVCLKQRRYTTEACWTMRTCIPLPYLK